jgi:hypothetical protein
MAASKHWSDLSGGARGLIIAVAATDITLRVAALIDITRRPASQIRGPKWAWAAAVAVVNSAGVLPVTYFALARRPPPSQPE